LEDKVVLITGASRGMGKSYAIACARDAPAVAVDHLANAGAANEVVETIEANGGSAFAVKANIAGQTEVDHMAERVIDRFGRVDVFVGNAGILFKAPVMEHSERLFDDVLAVNVKGNFLCAQRVAQNMIPRGSGKIVFCGTPEDQVGADLCFATSELDRATGQALIVDGEFTAIQMRHDVGEGSDRS